MEAIAEGAETVAIPDLVYSAFVRIATHGNSSPSPLSPVDAFAFCEHLQALRATVPLQEGPDHWGIFKSLVLASGISGSRTSDAYLAAFAIENDATFVTFDRGFRRFEGLKLQVLE